MPGSISDTYDGPGDGKPVIPPWARPKGRQKMTIEERVAQLGDEFLVDRKLNDSCVEVWRSDVTEAMRAAVMEEREALIQAACDRAAELRGRLRHQEANALQHFAEFLRERPLP